MALTDNEVKTEFVIELIGTRRSELSLDVKAAGCEDDGEREPETAVRRERGGTEGVSDRHFPAQRPSALQLDILALD